MGNKIKKKATFCHHFLIGKILFFLINLLGHSICLATQIPDIITLKNRSVLDDYYSNVVYGYNIVSDTQAFAKRFVGNKLNCTHCHRGVGTMQEQLPLNIAGIYPQWKATNSQITDLNLKIRQCFVYSHNGVMPPANSPEITAIMTYISYLSINQVIGRLPKGRGVSTLSNAEYDPNPSNGKIVYQQQCSRCHGSEGEGGSDTPPVWGIHSYSVSSGMNNIQTAASFIKTKMSTINVTTLSVQQAWDVAAFLRKQDRPKEAGKGKLAKLLQDLMRFLK